MEAADHARTGGPLWLRAGSWLTRRSSSLRHLSERRLALRNRWFPPGIVQLERAVGSPRSLLEVGCGDHSPIAWFGRKPERSIGVDLFEPALERNRAAGIHDEYRRLDVREIGLHFDPHSLDVVVALDLIEHLTEAEGLRLLEDMERIARRRVVVFTPNGFLEQGEYGGNPWQVHRSGWSARRMRELGYQVHGLNGLRWLRGAYATPRWRPRPLWELVSALTQPLVGRYPSLAFQILCVKSVAGAP